MLKNLPDTSTEGSGFSETEKMQKMPEKES